MVIQKQNILILKKIFFVLFIICNILFVLYINTQYFKWDANHLHAAQINQENLLSILISFILLITISQYIIFKENTYLFYAIYLLTNLYYFIGTFVFLNINTLKLPKTLFMGANILSLPCLIATYFFYLHFCISFLNIKQMHPSLNKKLATISKLFIAIFIICFLGLPTSYEEFFKFFGLIILITIVLVSLVGIILIIVYSKSKIKNIFIVGTSLLFCGHTAGFLIGSKILNPLSINFPFNNFITYTELGTVLEILVFSCSFAYRTKLIQEQQKKDAEDLIQQLKENEKKEARLKLIRDDIARDLHDEIGSSLTGINILSIISSKTLHNNTTQTEQMLFKISEQAQLAQQNMSDIVWSIKSDNDKIEDMVIRMREYIATTLEPLQIKTVFNIEPLFTKAMIPLELRKDIILIFKEIINNICKHANCTIVNISFYKENTTLILQIIDNGIGFDAINTNKGNGLNNLQQRAANINGKLQIIAAKNQGCKITLAIAIP